MKKLLLTNGIIQCDTNALADLYHEDAINHQVANEPIEGKYIKKIKKNINFAF